MKHMKQTRRQLLKNASTAFGFTLLPSYLATGARAEGDPLPPSKRINLGCVGVGGRASGVIPSLCSGQRAQPVAFCDVDFKARRVENNLKKYPGVKQFQDFRVMMEQMGKDIDAVSVVVPDHSHFPATMLAMSMGKHVYVEKPLTHSFQEAEMLMQAEKKFKVVTQMGNQGHTGTAPHQFQEWVKRGIIQNVTHIDAWKGPSLFFMNASTRIKDYPPEEPRPETLNWDLWCGPAEVKPFNKLYHPFSWRGFHLYGSGMLGDWGAHIIDFAHDYLKLGLPTKIEAQRLDDHNPVIFPLNSQIRFEFPARGDMPAVTLDWKDGADREPDVPTAFWDIQGEKKKKPKLGGAGTLLHMDGKDYKVLRGSHGGSSRLLPYAKSKELDVKVDTVRLNHGASFTMACMDEGKTWSPFSISGELTQILTLGCIAQYFNADLDFDPKTKQITNHAEA
ncbi:MAG: Gfo/Idh/MocA family oxidoreductase, partial [Verrucomicrobiota bacterium]